MAYQGKRNGLLEAYDHCRHLVERWPNRWTSSSGEKEAGDWMEGELARMGYETRQVTFACPGWEHEGEEFYLEGKPLPAGAQFYSVGCDVTGPVAVVKSDGRGGFTGEVRGKIAVLEETETTDVIERNAILLALESAGALAAGKEADGKTKWASKQASLRDGLMDVGKFMEILIKQGYDGWISLEDFTKVPSKRKLIDDLTYLKELEPRAKAKK